MDVARTIISGKPIEPIKLKYGLIGNLLFLFKDIAREYPRLAVYLPLEAALGAASPLIGIYLPKAAVDLATGAAGASFHVLGMLIAALVICMALNNMASNGKYFMYNDMRSKYIIRLYYQSLECDYRHIESAEGQTKYQLAMNAVDIGDQSGTSRMTASALDIVIAALSFLIYSGILATLHFAAVIFLAALSLVNYFAVRHAQAYEQSQKDRGADLTKKIWYVKRTADDYAAGKDIRLYGMKPWFISLHRQLLSGYSELLAQIRMRHFFAGAVNALTLLLRDGLAYGYLIWAVSSGRATVGEFILYFGAVAAVSGLINRVAGDINELAGANIQMNDLRAFLDNTDSPDPPDPAPPPAGDKLSVEFRDVCFSYDGKAPVLDGFSLKIGPGEKIALVGVNGAGKTTIVKLLCGFYAPDAGEILINGIDIRRFRKKDLQSLFSAIFQDVYIMPVTVAENVSMRPEADTDMARAEECLRRAGLLGEIEKHPGGMRAPMLKDVDDGIALSGGQSQKLLMARAIYKNGPLLVFDEPTAALDPIAESETYQGFDELAGGRTAVYISHRLASTQFCDRVAFLHDGKAAEVGAHADLIGLGGRYAEMYAIQSHYYKEGRVE